MSQPWQTWLCLQRRTHISWLPALVFFPVSNRIQGPDFCLFLCSHVVAYMKAKGMKKAIKPEQGKKGKSSLELQLDARTAPGWVQARLLAPEAAGHLMVIIFSYRLYGIGFMGLFLFPPSRERFQVNGLSGPEQHKPRGTTALRG